MNCVLLSEKRTGSTFLQTALNSHPDITSYDELFIMRTRKDKRDNTSFFIEELLEAEQNSTVSYSVPGLAEAYLRRIYNKDKPVIFNLIYSQIETWYGDMDLVSVLRNVKMNKVIHLKRDYLDTILSMKIKELHRKSINNIPVEKITLKIDKLKEEIKLYKNRYDKWAEIYKPELSIDFEDVLPISEKTLSPSPIPYGMYNNVVKTKTYIRSDTNKILCDFFGVKDIPMYSHLSKFITDKWQYVENADEIRSYFKK